MKQYLGWIITGAIGAVALVAFFMYIGASNQEISLRNKIEAKQKSCEAYYDKLWKIISQKAEVSQEYKNSFRDIYVDIMSARYSDGKGGGSLMKWIQESNPTFDVSLFKDLSASIEAERQGFFVEQQGLIDLNREHKNLLMTFPSSLFVGSRPLIDIKIITSAKTEQVYQTQQENEVNVFQEKK